MKKWIAGLFVLHASLCGAADVVAPLQLAQAVGDPIAPETLGQVRKLPARWPAHWIVAQDASFFHMSDGKFIVLDVTADETFEQFKGMFNGSKIAQFTQSRTRPEIYVAETFLSRGQRGERTDVLTIYSKETIAPIAEVVIPPKRISQIPTQYAVQLTRGESLALVLNFNPAQSVSVVDVVNRKFLGEVPIPGCSGVYALTGSGFSSLCANGTIYSVVLNADGSVASTSRSEKVFDTDEDALFERAAMIDGVGYFPTFLGNVVPIDLRGDGAQVASRWSLLGPGDEGWRPGGIQVAAADDAGRLYVLMHAAGHEGTHKDPGTEVWIYDVAAKRRIARHTLQLPALTFTVTSGENPLLVTTNVELGLDVYNAADGSHQRTLAAFGQETPLALHPAQ